MNDWPVEEIPDADALFYRVPVGWLGPNHLRPPTGIFSENKGSMSTDWGKYSTAAETRARQGRPERFAVLKMIAGQVREVRGLTVIHSPTQNVEGLPDNRAHTDIFGLDTPALLTPDLSPKERIRVELYERFKVWEIAPNAPVE